MRYKVYKYIFAIGAIMLFGCTDHDDWLSGNGSGNEIKISGDINQECVTRVDDGGFVSGDAIGLYVVDYTQNGAGELASTGNHANNVKYTYNGDGSWTGASKLYWTDSNTYIDAYSYYPFSTSVSDVTAHPYSVQRRQDKDATADELGGYEASDFLWAKAENVKPMTTIKLNHQHIMSSVQVSLVEGEGFADSEWVTLDKSVVIVNTLSEASIDLRTGVATADESSNRLSITPYKYGDDFRCIVIPQTVDANEQLIQISINGELYNFIRSESTTYQSGKLHKFAIKVDHRDKSGYTFTLISESVGAWENDVVSHDADARAYITVNVPTAGGLQKAVDATGFSYSNIKNLKITGKITESDFEFIRKKLRYLEAINLKDVETLDCEIDGKKENNVIPDYAFYEENNSYVGYYDYSMYTLKYVVLPEKMTKIGAYAFRATTLTQDIILPEGVTYVGAHAFDNSDVNGEKYSPNGGIWYTNNITSVSLPTTLTYIGDYAFAGCPLEQEIVLPENLDYLGERAFESCSNVYGTLHLPQSLNKIARNTFYGLKNLTGNLEIPSSVEEVERGAFAKTSFSTLILNEGIKHIGQAAFSGLNLYFDNEANYDYYSKSEVIPFSGDLIIPTTVTQIDQYAFAASGFQHVYLPNNFEEIAEGMFAGCEELLDTITIPSKVNHIGAYSFQDCKKLTAVILPKNLMSIGENCFTNCWNLDYIQCLSETPPTLVGEGHFDGVAKDNFTLVVPEGCVNAYRNAAGWSEFKRISEYRNFVCRPQQARLLNKSNKRDIVLNADGAWTVTHCPSWAHISKTSGTQKTELSVTIDELTKGSGNRVDSIVFSLTGTDHTAYYKIEQYDSEYAEDGQYTLQKATKGKGINLVILGDGYDAADIANGTYLDAMKQSAEYFFDVEPYKTYRDYFNVYTVFAMSYESGIGTLNTLRNVKFNTMLANSSGRISCNYDDALFYAVDNTPVEESETSGLTCIVVANTTVYDGVTAMYGNGAAVALCPQSTAEYPYDARGTVQHEAGGHGFGKLADEYIYHAAWIQTCRCTDCEHVSGLQAMHNNGWGQNLSLEGKYKTVPWAHLINDSQFSDLADIYEGGYFHSRGVYRSERNSCMNNNVPYYSTWSRELIVKRIKELAGETFSYEEFAKNDSREWGQDFTRTTRSTQGYKVKGSAPKQGNAPIIVKGKPKRKVKK